jgi:mono/diheme cytochrome c family protein
VTYVVAVLLFVGAAAFAWMRSSQLRLVDEPSVVARYAPAPDLAFHWQELGSASYAANCANCHGADGTGWDQYPPLQPTGAMLRAPQGRDYLIDLVLHGLASNRWGAPMPRMHHMHDVEIAAVLNYMLVEFGGTPPTSAIRPEHVAPRRAQSPHPREVNTRRPAAPTP